MTTVFLSSLFGLSFAVAAAAVARPPATLTLMSIEGGELRARGIVLRAGQVLPPGTPLQLTGGAKIVISAGDRGRILMRGPAAFSVRAKGESGVDLAAGSALAKLDDAQGRLFSLGTPSALVAARGATFFVEARGRQGTYLCACAGVVELSSRTGRFKARVAAEGKHKPFLFDLAPGRGVQNAAAVERHSDQDIAEFARAP